MRFLITGLIFVIAIFLQYTFADLMAIAGVKPNFILIYLVVLSIKYGRLFGGIAGFIMGIIEDSIFTAIFGLNALCKSFVGFFVTSIPTSMFGTALLNTGILLFIADLFHDFLYNWIYSFGSGTGAVYLLFRFAIPGALYTSLVGMIIWAILPGFFGLQDEQQ